MPDLPDRPRGLPPFAVELNTWTLDELQVAVRQLEGLEAHEGWKALRTVIDAAREQEIRTMVNSELELTQAQYAHQAGKVKGLELLTTALEAVRYKAARREKDVRERHEQERAEGIGGEEF